MWPVGEAVDLAWVIGEEDAGVVNRQEPLVQGAECFIWIHVLEQIGVEPLGKLLERDEGVG